MAEKDSSDPDTNDIEVHPLLNGGLSVMPSTPSSIMKVPPNSRHHIDASPISPSSPTPLPRKPPKPSSLSAKVFPRPHLETRICEDQQTRDVSSSTVSSSPAGVTVEEFMRGSDGDVFAIEPQIVNLNHDQVSSSEARTAIDPPEGSEIKPQIDDLNHDQVSNGEARSSNNSLESSEIVPQIDNATRDQVPNGEAKTSSDPPDSSEIKPQIDHINHDQVPNGGARTSNNSPDSSEIKSQIDNTNQDQAPNDEAKTSNNSRESSEIVPQIVNSNHEQVLSSGARTSIDPPESSEIEQANTESAGEVHTVEGTGAIEAPPNEVAVQPSRSNRTIYRLICSDMEDPTKKKQVIRYSWTPFEGLWSNLNDEKAREELAVMDICDMITGQPLQQRRSQHRQTFGTRADSDPDPFVVGIDFFSRVRTPTHIRIHSPHLQSLINSIIVYYPGYFDVFGGSKEMALLNPFEPLFHYWDEFQSVIDGFKQGNTSIALNNPESGFHISVSCDQMMYDHLKVLLTCSTVDKLYQEKILPEKILHNDNKASFNNLWLLYKPGEIVFTKVSGQLAGYVVITVVLSAKIDGDTPHAMDRLAIKLWNLAYDDGQLTRQSHIVFVKRYQGNMAISDLPAFPTRFMSNHDTAKEELIKRGKRYYSIICDLQRHMRYNGLVIGTQKPYQYEGDIIVDHRGYKAEKTLPTTAAGTEPEDMGGEPLFSKFNKMKCSHDNELKPDQYLLLPGHVHGFSLKDKQWAKFDMACVHDVPEEPNPMRHLIIDDDNKNLVLAAAGSPREGTALTAWTTDWNADFIDGKGKGKVIYLHGSPGTGKTMTVECIAKYTRRPLICLSVADLGTAEFHLEKRLFMWLGRAASWGAIVLIDECEVYLEQRERGEVSRNALVAAFLRTLEYFPGLMFLTSNSSGTIDEAVRSRIHLAILYKRPDAEQRKRVWEVLFQKLIDDQEKRSILKFSTVKTSSQVEHQVPASLPIEIQDSAKSLAFGVTDTSFQDLKLNGRDIRNIILSAISVAKFDSLDKSHGETPTKVIVTGEHLRKVLKNKAAFEQDFKTIFGVTPDGLAQQRSFRAQETET